MELARARGRQASQGDVAHFQAALRRADTQAASEEVGPQAVDGTAITDPSSEAVQFGLALGAAPLAQASPNTKDVGADVKPTLAKPADALDEADPAEAKALAASALNSASSARLRWLQRLQSKASDRDDAQTQTPSDAQALASSALPVTPLAIQSDLKAAVSNPTERMAMAGQVSTKSDETFVSDAAPSGLAAARLTPQERMAVAGLTPSNNDEDQGAPAEALTQDLTPPVQAAPVSQQVQLPASIPNSATPVALKDSSAAVQTVQDTVRSTLRTLAQRDLDALDAGRPVQVTLDQGQLRGAILTLQARDGLLEVTVSAPQARLQAVLETQQDVVAQGLQRDVGAVRWLGLQESQLVVNDASTTQRQQEVTLAASGADADAQSFGSRQNGQSQGGSDQRQQPNNPAPEVLESTERPRVDGARVVADAQALRSFLGL
jgi:hypothetical protein